MQKAGPPPTKSLANSFPIFSPLSASFHLKNGVTFTTLMEKRCQRSSQSAEKFQKVFRSNPTLVNSKWYISDIAASESLKSSAELGVSDVQKLRL